MSDPTKSDPKSESATALTSAGGRATSPAGRRRLLVVLTFLGVGVAAESLDYTAEAATHHVPADYETIQAAIDATEDGDSVLVAPGTYSGEGNRNISFRGRNIVVTTEGGPRVTTVDVLGSASDPGRGFLIDGGEGPSAILEGFTIINGWMSTEETFRLDSSSPPVFRDERHDLSGGGFKVNFLSSPTVRNLVVRRCHSEYTGGGASVELQSSPHLENIRIEACTAGIQGGGLSIETTSSPTVEDCVFVGNRSANGGGVASHSTFTMKGCTIASNEATTRGGGLSVFTFTEGTYERLLIWGNCSSRVGDEVFIDVQAFADFSCSLVDTSGVENLGVVDWGEDLVAGDPLFCVPTDCTQAPVPGGAFTMADTSPALAVASPCGTTIGALGLGACGFPTSWGRIKSRFQGEGDDPGLRRR